MLAENFFKADEKGRQPILTHKILQFVQLNIFTRILYFAHLGAVDFLYNKTRFYDKQRATATQTKIPSNPEDSA